MQNFIIIENDRLNAVSIFLALNVLELALLQSFGFTMSVILSDITLPETVSGHWRPALHAFFSRQIRLEIEVCTSNSFDFSCIKPLNFNF